MASHSPLPESRNRLLTALPPRVLAELWPRLEPVELPFRQTVQTVAEPMDAVLFPESGWISMLAYLEDGDAAEVGLVGREGMVGLPLLLEAECDDIEGMVQGPGVAMRINKASFRQALDDLPAFRSLLLRYALVHHGQVARTAACNGRHHTDQRLARWLLMAHDRADGDEYPMTHEFLSMMLGVRRAGISVSAGQLQKAGHIRYERGRMQVIDRPGLESVACECYGMARRAHDRLLDPGRPSGTEYRR